jgi:CelD/BcsL family acetyltransferase involved in cellulose biosynthesis
MDGAEAIRLEPLTDLREACGEWEELARPTRNVFATWEWNATWWRFFGARKQLAISLCRREDGQLIGVLPLYVWSARPFRVVRFLGHRAGDELGPICIDGAQPEMTSAILRVLDHLRADVLVAEHAPVEDGWSRLLGARQLTAESSPSFRADGLGWNEFLAQRSSSFRQSLGRKERRLHRNHNVRYRLTASPEELEGDLDTLFALHTARWGGAKTNFLRCEPFHRAFASAALARGWLRLWTLEVDGVARASWYGFRYSGVESFYQGGRDPHEAWTAYSLGLLILAHSMRAAFEDRVSEYRLLRGGEAYKSHFTESTRAVETFALARGLSARVALATAVRMRRSRIVKAVVAA